MVFLPERGSSLSTDEELPDGEGRSEVAVAPDPPALRRQRPWVTFAVSGICIAIYLITLIRGKPEDLDALARLGFLTPERIYAGAYWALFTSAFVHFAIWHVFFNLYCFWLLGQPLERVLGHLPFLALVILAAGTCGAWELAAAGTTGIGLSGVVYAVFGFVWMSRKRCRALSMVLTRQDETLILAWLVGCFVATYLGLAHIANGAHLAGCLLGSGLGAWWVGMRPRWATAGVILLVAGAVMTVFWAPWSAEWNGYKALEARNRYHDLTMAENYYRRSVDRGADRAWGWYNIACLYAVQGRRADALALLARALKVEPRLRGQAAGDGDFAALRHDPEFRQLTGS